MVSCMTFAHVIYALMFQTFTHFGALSSRLCQNLFISPETKEKLSNVGRI